MEMLQHITIPDCSGLYHLPYAGFIKKLYPKSRSVVYTLQICSGARMIITDFTIPGN